MGGHYFISFFSFDFFFFDSLSFDINFSFDDCIVLGVLQSFFFHHSFVSLSILSRQVNSKAANIHHYYGRFFSVLTSACPIANPRDDFISNLNCFHCLSKLITLSNKKKAGPLSSSSSSFLFFSVFLFLLLLLT